MEYLLTSTPPPPYLSPSLLHFNTECFFITRPNPSLFCLSASPSPNTNTNPIPNLNPNANPNRDSGMYSENSWKMLESLSTWSVPLALGASVGSLIPHKLVIFSASVSLLVIVIVQKVLEPKGEYLITVGDVKKIMRSSVYNGLNDVKASLNRAVGVVFYSILSLKSIIKSFFIGKLSVNPVMGRINGSFQGFLNFFRAFTRSVPFERKGEVKSQMMSQSSAFLYIKDRISEVKNLIQTEKSNTEMIDPNQLKELREMLGLLKEAIMEKELAIQSKSSRKSEDIEMTKGKLESKVNKKNKMKKKDKKEECSEIDSVANMVESLEDSNELKKQDNAMHNMSQLDDVDTLKSRQYNGSHKPENLWNETEFEHDVLTPKVAERSIEQSNEKTISNSSTYPDYWLQDDKGDDHASKSTSTFRVKQREKKTEKAGEDIVSVLKPEGDGAIKSKNMEAKKVGEVDERDLEGYESCSKENVVENNDFKSRSKGNVVENNNLELDKSSKKDETEEEFSNDPLDLMEELAFVREDSNMPSGSGFSNKRQSIEYQDLMNEGEFLFKSGKTGLSGKIQVGEAETMLYRAAERFGSACSIDSSSIEAIGLWGNTLFVHGKLKLKLVKEIQFIISTVPMISSYRRRKQNTEIQEARKWVALEETLQTISEECEELLIQAGRKYRAVLSITNRDIPALYNWGLTLSLRAQLVASGKNSAESADKVYLAAIDKFEALMGISRRYAPDAMRNWGLALRARSRLYPMTSPERINLLNQAKQLFEDALRLQPRDAQICGAYAASNIELEELQRKEMESKRNTRLDR